MADSRTLFVGAGATGGYFGGRLAQAGKDVTFLVRPRRAAILAERGLRIHAPDGGTDVITPRTVTTGAIDGPYDLVVLGVKAFALDSAIADLAPAVGPETVVVPLLNGMRHLDALREAFGERAYGGVCIVMTTLDGDGDIVQLSGVQHLGFGPVSGVPAERVTEALSGGGFPAEASATILHDMWEKWVLLASLGAVNCLMRGTVGEVNAAPGGTAFALGIAGEAVAIATAAGYPPRTEDRLRATVTGKGASSTSSMYRDLVQGLPIEADQIIGDLVARAAALGVPAPLLAATFTNLRVYELSRG
jgi:2-dehydropantoate 2-reductase